MSPIDMPGLQVIPDQDQCTDEHQDDWPGQFPAAFCLLGVGSELGELPLELIRRIVRLLWQLALLTPDLLNKFVKLFLVLV